MCDDVVLGSGKTPVMWCITFQVSIPQDSRHSGRRTIPSQSQLQLARQSDKPEGRQTNWRSDDGRTDGLTESVRKAHKDWSIPGWRTFDICQACHWEMHADLLRHIMLANLNVRQNVTLTTVKERIHRLNAERWALTAAAEEENCLDSPIEG